jgi:hypothetical protein
MANQSKTSNLVKTLILALLLGAGVSYLSAWTGPATSPLPNTPPNNNVPAPLNVGNSSQSKLGQLFINTSVTSPYAIGLLVFGESVFDSNTPGQPAVQINDGTAQPGYVLTSTDASGTASWQASTGSGTGSSTNLVFLNSPITIGNQGSTAAPLDTTYRTADVSSYVPAGATAVILQSQVALEAPDCFYQTLGYPAYVTDTCEPSIIIRKDSASPSLLLISSAAGGQDDAVAAGGQGFFPIASNRSFQYKESGSFGGGATIELIGYINGPVTAVVQPAPQIGVNTGGYQNMIVYDYNSVSTGAPVETPGTYTWVAPAGVTTVKVEAWGGNASNSDGYGVNTVTYSVNGGYAESIVSVTPGQSYTISVGADSSCYNSACTGGTSSFGNLVSATGGNTSYSEGGVLQGTGNGQFNLTGIGHAGIANAGRVVLEF